MATHRSVDLAPIIDVHTHHIERFLSAKNGNDSGALVTDAADIPRGPPPRPRGEVLGLNGRQSDRNQQRLQTQSDCFILRGFPQMMALAARHRGGIGQPVLEGAARDNHIWD